MPESSGNESEVCAAAVEFHAAAQRCLAQFAGWTAARWRVEGDGVHRVLQLWADYAATARQLPRREVPRLDSDFALADQLAVVSHDLEAALRGVTVEVSAGIYAAATIEARQLLAS